MHDTGNFNRTVLPFFLKVDWHCFGTKHCRDERGQVGHRTTIRTCKDCLKGLTLLLICSLIEIESNGPISISHRAWCARDQRDIQAIKGRRIIPATINVEAKGHLASSRCWLRSHRRVWGNETGTHYITIAVLEVVSGDLPGHINLLPVSPQFLCSCIRGFVSNDRQ